MILSTLSQSVLDDDDDDEDDHDGDHDGDDGSSREQSHLSFKTAIL